MTEVNLDTYKFIERLVREGVPKNQAEAMAYGFKEADLQNIATKEDIAVLKQEITSVENRLEQKIEKLRSEFFKFLLGQAAFIVALMKLLP